MAKHEFQTEVNQLLQLMIHSLYSNKEIFLRELISNASDACDKLNHLVLTDDAYKNVAFEGKVELSFDEEAKTLTIEDTGIGMNEADLVAHLGTIAKSGTKSFIDQMSGDAKKDSHLIGQFGVGFYSAFMVASKVDVVSKKAGTDTAFRWSSDGSGSYELDESVKETHGTKITLTLNDEGKEYAGRYGLENIVKKYSDHIPYAIFLSYEDVERDDEGKETGKIQKHEQINAASALWTVPKADLTEDEYNNFYKSISNDNEDPMKYVHTKAEGANEYTTLFYIPKKAPMDLYRVDYKPGVKLYVQRVFITDDEKELLPTYLRFVRGIIDSQDLPLNVSRELLQNNRVMANIQSASVKKVLDLIKKIAKDDAAYTEFITEFNRPLKEGVYQDQANKDKLLDLIRYKSNKVDGWVSLAEYKDRMGSDQKAIYYITGENFNNLKNSPLLESFNAKGLEVLIMDDEIDEIITPSITEYKETPLKSVAANDAADELKSEDDKKEEEKSAKDAEGILKKMTDILGESVKEVKASTRLSDSPSCLVSGEDAQMAQMAQMMRSMGQEMPESAPILEINPTHDIVKKLEAMNDDALFEDATHLLFDQATLLEGKELKDPALFAKRLNKMLASAI
jgi:molecular chaperone HtpG